MPPKGTPLAAILAKATAKLLGISYVQRGESSSLTEHGLIRSCVLVSEPTPWMRVWDVVPVFYQQVGAIFREGEMLFARIEPPRPKERLFECTLHFHTGASFLISEVAGTAGATDLTVGNIHLSPMTPEEQQYFDAVQSAGMSEGLLEIAELSPQRGAPTPRHAPPLPRPGEAQLAAPKETAVQATEEVHEEESSDNVIPLAQSA